jgi:signal transduction histidine kinase
MGRLGRILWPQSLYWQLIGAVALGLLFIQGISAIGGYYAQSQIAVSQAAFVLRENAASTAEKLQDRGQGWDAALRPTGKRGKAQIAFMITPRALVLPGYTQDPELSQAAQQLLQTSGQGLDNASVSIGPVSALPKELSGPPMQSRFVRRLRNQGSGAPAKAILLTAQARDGRWISSASFVRPPAKWALLRLVLKTLAIFAAVMLPLALVARRIVRPLERLAERAARVGISDEAVPLESKGPADIRNLIDNFNIMQSRVTSLLSEKDVMLGAIGHDLKTPLASLRVRVESVEDDQERDKMAATINEMATILDDILMLARLGKSGEASQRTDIGALIESVTEEFATSGADIEVTAPEQRVIANIRPVLIRRALRNVIGNALEYGASAKIMVQQTGDKVAIIIDDNGPGIAADKIEQMFEPFVRAEGSRNRDTGGSGLGLTIARSILRSHGGDIRLENRAEGGLRVLVELPN